MRAAAPLLILVAGCAGGAVGAPVASAPTRPEPPTASTTTDGAAPTTPPTKTDESGPAGSQADGPNDASATHQPDAPHLVCPEEMALVRRAKGPYCIDRWEASLVTISQTGDEKPWPGNRAIDDHEDEVRAVSRPGVNPQGYISGEQAEQVCQASGKRLCEIDEWVVACRGPALATYPYGDERQPNKCNDRYKVLDKHPIPRLFRRYAPPGADPKLMWHPRWMDDSRIHEMSDTIVPTGSRKECSNEWGIYDMVGNLHEWVADPEGTFFGGFFMDTFQNGHGCGYRTIGHPYDYHDYSTGFRCCAEATPASRGEQRHVRGR